MRSPDSTVDGRLVEYVAASTGLSVHEAARVIGDVLDFHAESVEAYVRRRHGELQRRGRRNPQIFARLATEVTGRMVSAPALSERQLRRIVYG